MISDRAHVILPWHFEEDRLLNERCTSGEAIGTTMRGIGPCYRDKVGRSWAIRLGDMYRPEFRKRVEQITQAKNEMFAGFGPGALRLDAAEVFADYSRYAERLRPFVADTTAYLLNAAEANRRILFEGAQVRCWMSTMARSLSSPAAIVPAWASPAGRECRAGTLPRSSGSSRRILLA